MNLLHWDADAMMEAELQLALITGPYGDYWVAAGRPLFVLRRFDTAISPSWAWVIVLVDGRSASLVVTHFELMANLWYSQEGARLVLALKLGRLFVSLFPTPRHLAWVLRKPSDG